MANKTKIKKGDAYIVRGTNAAPGGDCEAENCMVSKRLIGIGMTLVKQGGKKYHASCAKYAGITFIHPKVETVRRAADG